MESVAEQRFEWVELLDPKTHRTMYVNLSSGECCWDPPPDKEIKPMSSNQWWELYDVKAQRNYYYNSGTRETVWQKPEIGEIIPLANLQLLQQTTQEPPSSTINRNVDHNNTTTTVPSDYTRTLDIGVFRRTVPKENTTACTGRRSQHRKLPTSVLECRSRITQDLENFAENRRHTQQLPSDDQRLQKPSQPPLDSTSQRIRDWLRGTNSPTGEDKSLVSVSAGDTKGLGCLSDRPVRRIHQLPIPVTSMLSTTVETTPRTMNTLDTNTPNLNEQPTKVSLPINGVSLSQHTSVPRFGLPHTSINPLRNSVAEIQSHGPLQSVSTRTPISMPLQSCFEHRVIKSSSPAAVSPNAQGSEPRGLLSMLSDSSIGKPSNTSTMPPGNLLTNSSQTSIVHDRSSYSSLSSVEPTPGVRPRAFPRTNPTISRPPTAANAMPSKGPSFVLATTLDRPATSSVVLSPIEPNTTRSGCTMPQHRAIPTSSVTPSSPFLPIASSGVHPPNASNRITTEGPPDSVLRSDSSTRIKESPSLQSVRKQEEQVSKQFERRRVSISTKSASSDSLHPSSSPSSSFSRASSATALTNTTSEEASEGEALRVPATSVLPIRSNEQNVPTMTFVGEKVDANFVTPYPPVLGPPNVPQTHNYIEPEEVERPPLPPPRSASTLGQNRFHQEPLLATFEEFNQWKPMYHANTVHPYMVPDQRPYIVYNPRFQYFPSGPYPPTEMPPPRGAAVSSSLSRTDPMRAHVIQPNHRRFTPFYSQYRPGFLPVDNFPVYYVQTPDAFNQDYVGASVEVSCTTPLLGPPCAPNMDLNHSTGTVPTVVTSPSTTTTWVSHSTATWEGLQKNQSRVEQAAAEADTCFADSGNTTSLSGLKRSPSGGFIGPEESNEPVWLTASDTKISSMPQLPLYTLVHPGLPAFERFIGPFEWPKHLFKPEQDVSTIMAWTKAKFSKRLLISTDPSLKKQVANTFKMIQSFMGDRKARLSLPDYGSIIIHRALNCVGLRDELFAHLCKQTTGNSDIKSLTDGWALLCVCLYYFPPNNQFRDPLKNYLTARAEAALTTVYPSEATTDKMSSRMASSLKTAAAIASGLAPLRSDFSGPTINSGLSQPNTGKVQNMNESPRANDLPGSPLNMPPRMPYPMDLPMGTFEKPSAAHFARVAPRWFLRSLNVGSRKFAEPPSIDEICHVKDFILKPCIFGSSLEEIMRLQACRFPHLKLPWIQIFLTEELLRLGGARTEGVFRLSPDLDVITELRCQLEKLFEIFRVVYNAESDSALPNSGDPTSSDRFVILRPPPVGWSASFSQSDSSRNANDSTDPSSAPSLENTGALTGEYKWPVVPLPLSSPPSEYILLTPTAHWPRSLLAMAKQSPLGFSTHQVDAHLAAGLLKLWLRELAEPLVPTTLQPLCLKAAAEAELYESNPSGKSHQTDPDPIQACCLLIRKLPLLERRCLLYLILLLQRLAKPENASVSLMDPRNLATVIAPNLMRSSSTDPKELLENIRPQTLFVRLLISHLDVPREIQALMDDEQQLTFGANWSTPSSMPTTIPAENPSSYSKSN